jgi:hypothetical protein
MGNDFGNQISHGNYAYLIAGWKSAKHEICRGNIIVID